MRQENPIFIPNQRELIAIETELAVSITVCTFRFRIDILITTVLFVQVACPSTAKFYL